MDRELPREPHDHHPGPDRRQDPQAGHLAGRGGRRGRLPLRLRLLRGQRRRRRHQGRVRPQRGRDRLRRGRGPPGLRGGRLPGRQGGRPLRPHPGHEARRAAVPGQRHRHRLRVRRLGPDLLAPGGRPGHRPGLGDRAGLHLRDLPAPRPRPPGLAPAAGHHHRHLRRPALRRPVRQRPPAARTRPSGSASRPGAGCSWPPPSPPSSTAGSPSPCPNRRGSWSSRARTRRPCKVFKSIAPDEDTGPPPARHQEGHRGGQARRPEGLPARQGLRPAAGGLDRHHPVRAAAVRRHQRDLLLLHHPVEGRGLPGEGLAHHLRGHRPSPTSW